MYVDTCFGCLNLIRIFETLFYVCSVWCSTCRTADSAVQCWGLECPNFASNNDCSRGLLGRRCLDSTTSYDYLTMPHTTSPHNRKLGKLFSAQLWKMCFFLVEPRGHVLPVTRPQSLARVRAVSRVTCHVSRVDTNVQLMGTTNPRVQLPNWSQTHRLTERSLK